MFVLNKFQHVCRIVSNRIIEHVCVEQVSTCFNMFKELYQMFAESYQIASLSIQKYLHNCIVLYHFVSYHIVL